jgi:protein-S-isoprenylcysteine O-methyltransferase Ste14
MGFWFNLSLLGFILILVPYFLSLEHDRLDEWFKENSQLMGDTLGILSGWGFFFIWISIWVSPQNRFHIGYPQVIIRGFVFTAINLGISLFFLAPALWFGLKGVTELGFKISETHRPDKIVKTGVYSVVRHPQYLGGLLGHFGVSTLLGSRDALIVSPIVVIIVYLVCWKEEKELIKEFGNPYVRYQSEIPMLIPRRG